MDGNINQKIFKALQQYLLSRQFKELSTDNPCVAAQLKEACEDDFTLDKRPTYVQGHFEGNLTGKGHCYAGDTRYEKTFCSDFNTGYFLFLNNASPNDENLKREVLQMTGGNYTEVFSIDDKQKILQEEVATLVKRELHKLDYWFDSARINSYTFVQDTEEAEIPFQKIYLTLKDEEGNAFSTCIGTYSLCGGEEKITIDVEKRIVYQPIYKNTSITAKNKAAKEAKKRKILIGILVAVGVLVAAGIAVVGILSTF